MSDKEKMPRMREQFKDNAVEVEKNASVKAELRKEELREKAEHVKEKEQDDAPEIACGYGCGCGCEE